MRSKLAAIALFGGTACILGRSSSIQRLWKQPWSVWLSLTYRCSVALWLPQRGYACFAYSDHLKSSFNRLISVWYTVRWFLKTIRSRRQKCQGLFDITGKQIFCSSFYAMLSWIFDTEVTCAALLTDIARLSSSIYCSVSAVVLHSSDEIPHH